MTTALLDTNVIIDSFHGDTTFQSVLSGFDRLLVCPVVLGEYYAGLDTDDASLKALEKLKQFLSLSIVEVIPVSDVTAEYYASVFRFLKKSGKPIPTNDIWIAAQALETGAVLMTRDRHFSDIPTLRVHIA